MKKRNELKKEKAGNFFGSTTQFHHVTYIITSELGREFVSSKLHSIVPHLRVCMYKENYIHSKFY